MGRGGYFRWGCVRINLGGDDHLNSSGLFGACVMCDRSEHWEGRLAVGGWHVVLIGWGVVGVVIVIVIVGETFLMIFLGSVLFLDGVFAFCLPIFILFVHDHHLLCVYFLIEKQ